MFNFKTHKMKNLFKLSLLFMAISFMVSCSRNEEEVEVIKDTTYTFIYLASDVPEGIVLSITLFEYNDKDERIGQQSVKNVYNGFSDVFVANKNAQKVKVYLKTEYQDKSIYNWVQQVFYLESGSNTNIEITGETQIGKQEP